MNRKQFQAYLFLVLSCVAWKYCHAQDHQAVIHTCSNYTNFLHFYDIELPPGLMYNNVRTRFLLQRQDLDPGCINRISEISTAARVPGSKSSSSSNLHTPFKFDSDGLLKFGVNNFRVDEYCVQRYDGESVSVRICNSCPVSGTGSSGSKLCVPKCCREFTQVYDKKSSCVKPENVGSLLATSSDIDFHEPSVLNCFDLYKNDSSEKMVDACVKRSVQKPVANVHFYAGAAFTCASPVLLSTLADERFALLTNASFAVYLHDHERSLVLSKDFCFDHELHEGKLTTMILACLPDWASETPHNEIGIFPEKVAHIEQGDVVEDKIKKCKNSHARAEAHVPKIIAIPASTMIHGNLTWFSLNETVELSCTSDTYRINFTASNIISYEHDVNNTYFTREGVVLVKNNYYSPEEYCVEEYSERNQFIIIRACRVSCAGAGADDSKSGAVAVCIQKCCPWNKFMINRGEEEGLECVPATPGDVWHPTFLGDDEHANMENTTTQVQMQMNRKRRIHYKTGLTCPQHQHYSNTDDPPFDLLENGFVSILAEKGDIITVDPGKFCLDGEYIDGVLTAQAFGSCTPDNVCDSYQRALSTAYAPLMLISALFLLLTVIVYTLIWDKHNIHGWTVYALSISMFFMLLFLATGHIMTLKEYEKGLRGNKSCAAVGLLTHFFFLSTFCWMTILNFDLWWTFRNLTPASNKSKGWTRFGYYTLFCLGVPLFIVVVAVILDNVYSNSFNPRGLILPNYGIENCFLEHEAQGPYLYYVIAFLLLVNMSVFGNTIFIMYNYQKNTLAVRRGKPGNQSQAQLFAKLFFVMGVSWIFEFISWLFTNCENNSPIWIVFDIVNLAQGVAIFFIFVCKPQVLVNLWHKYPEARPFLDIFKKFPCCKFVSVDMDSREISGTKVTSTHNSSSLRHYGGNPTAVAPVPVPVSSANSTSTSSL